MDNGHGLAMEKISFPLIQTHAHHNVAFNDHCPLNDAIKIVIGHDFSNYKKKIMATIKK